MEYPVIIAQQSAQETQETKTDSEGGLFNPTGLMLLLGIFVFMYFFVIRPQRKEEKRKKEMLSQLSKGDRVVTASGMIGSIHSLKENTAVINVGEVKIEFLRSAISHLYSATVEPKKANKKTTA